MNPHKATPCRCSEPPQRHLAIHCPTPEDLCFEAPLSHGKSDNSFSETRASLHHRFIRMAKYQNPPTQANKQAKISKQTNEKQTNKQTKRCCLASALSGGAPHRRRGQRPNYRVPWPSQLRHRLRAGGSVTECWGCHPGAHECALCVCFWPWVGVGGRAVLVIVSSFECPLQTALERTRLWLR